jgi:hypothetical protein
MLRVLMTVFLFALVQTKLSAETVRFSTSNADYQITNVFGNVDLFTIDIDIDMPLSPGLYMDPTIISVSYRVFGSLEAGTPSGFSSFDLVRDMSGTDFYEQGSSLVFEIAADVDFTDGIQADELIDNGTILTLNAREIGNGRFHPAILELYTDGSGRIQNSNNIHTSEPLLEVNFGDEYITDLEFELASTTLFNVVEQSEPEVETSESGGGTFSWSMLLLLLLTRSKILNFN